MLFGFSTQPGSAARNQPAKQKPATGCQSSADLGALASALTGGGGGLFAKITSSATDVLLDSLVSELSYSAIEAFLTQMLDRPDILSKISVDIPEVSAHSPTLRKQTLNLGGYLAAIKGANLMVESAQTEFELAKGSYKKIMAHREKAAVALMEAFRNKEQLKEALKIQKAKGVDEIKAEDWEYVHAVLNKAPEDFFNDYQVQRVALAYMRGQPNFQHEITEMNTAQAEFKGHYGAYSRTVVGVGSMVGFSSLFLKKAKSLWEKEGLVGGAVLVPLLTQAAKEVGLLTVNVKNVFDASDTINEGTFLIEKGGEVVRKGITFQKALGQLDEAAAAKFKGEVIREDLSGYVSRLFLHSGTSAAALADRATSKNEKLKLAEAFSLDEPELFSFQNALAEKSPLKPAERKTVGKVFYSIIQPGKGKAGQVDEVEVALIAAQQKLINTLENYSNGDARRLMFARAGSGDGLWLGAGQYRIGIDNLGMEGLSDHMDFMINQTRHGTNRAPEKSVGGGKGASVSKDKK